MYSLLFFYVFTLGAIITEIQVITIYLVPGIMSFTASGSQLTTTLSASLLAATPGEWDYSGTFDFNRTFAEEMLEMHNEKRSKHHSQALNWNFTLFNFAQEYANEYDCSGILKHSGGDYGENLALGYTPRGAILAWYGESKTYDYQKHNTYNHFTAMVWNSTLQIGCGIKYCNPVWSNYIVCSYYPTGNVVGYSESNVFPI